MAVVIVNYNTRDHLVRCLASLEGAAAQTVVVDNASVDGSRAAVAARFPHVELIASPNLGYGAGANRGVARCRTPYVLLLNSDTVASPAALETLADHLDAHPLAGCAGPRLLNPDGTLQMSVQRFPTPLSRFIETRIRARDHQTARAVDWVKGAALALRRTAFDEAHGFDERYFMYFEEVDLCWRLRDLGWQTHFVPAAEVTHVGAASTSQDRGAMARQFEGARERFYRDHYAVARAGSFVLMERLRSAVVAGSRLLFARRPGGAS